MFKDTNAGTCARRACQRTHRVSQEVHEQVHHIACHVRELNGTVVDGLYQQLPVLASLLKVLVLRLDHLLLQHSHHLQSEDDNRFRTKPQACG